MRGRSTTRVRRAPAPNRGRSRAPRDDRGRRPPSSHLPRRRGGTLARVGTAIAVVVALLLLYGLGAVFYASSKITRQPVEGTQSGGVYHVLVTGSDSRENLTDEQRNELNTGAAGGGRTDTIFVLSVRGSRAAMLAFPRDLFVTLCDGSQARINAATTVGGPGCLVQTVSQVSGLPIAHWVQIDFLGFRDVVDAVGGVELCLDDPINDRDAGIDLPAGCQTLQGPDALGYVRVRKIDNDLERIKRQQEFLQALAGETAQPSTVLNPFAFYGTAGAVGGAVTADDGFSSVDLVRLGLAARGVANGRIVTETVPATDASVGGAAVLQIDDPAAEQVFERFRSGAVLNEAAADDSTVPPEEVELVVLNGSGVEGLAGRTAEELRARGFTVIDVGNAPASQRTVVRYPEGQEPAARTVAAQAPGALDIAIERDDDVGVVTLVLGGDSGG